MSCEVTLDTLCNSHGQMPDCPKFGESGGEIMQVAVMRDEEGNPTQVITHEEDREFSSNISMIRSIFLS